MYSEPGKPSTRRSVLGTKKVSFLSIIDVGFTTFFFFPLAPIFVLSFFTAFAIQASSEAAESSLQINGFPAKGEMVAIRVFARSTEAIFARFFASDSVERSSFIFSRNPDSLEEGASFLPSPSGGVETPSTSAFSESTASVVFISPLASSFASILLSSNFLAST